MPLLVGPRPDAPKTLMLAVDGAKAGRSAAASAAAAASRSGGVKPLKPHGLNK